MRTEQRELLFDSITRRFFVTMLATVLAIPCIAQDIDSGPSFEHVPLMYRGPDPTANYFLPHANGFESRLARLPSPSEVLPETQPGASDGFIEYSEPQEFWGEEMPGTIGHVSDHKDGFFQKIAFTGTYIDRGSLSSFGLIELDSSLSVVVPAPTREWPMLITPAFNVRYLDGPVAPMLPPRLYETYVDFVWVPRVSERWTAIIGVAPSLYSDFEISTSDAFRLTGKALARYDWVPDQVQVVFGVLYLNRNDVRLLPAGGVIWNPSLDRRYEMIFPRPKLAHRIDAGPGYEDWLYVGGEFGGNSWAYDSGGGIVDTVTLRDYRLLLGLERKLNGGAGYRIEIGYVFSRTAEFVSGIPDIAADDTALVRGGVIY
ncbi:MAG: hypothetical protein H8E66_26410 [Planctomycetes bacterium]|nr:hypothetical protein [Planctomycetota bacterium]